MVGKIELIFAELLMASEILRFENIEDYQIIYAIVWGCLFIADIYKIRKLWMSFINPIVN
jgi:hypothetical protein